MAESTGGGRTDPFSDLISLAAGPIAAVIRSFDQLRKGSDELMRGFENFNNTMEALNETATRINALLEEFEGPVRALMPQVTRTLKAADEMTSRLTGPVDDVIPGLNRLADTLNSPVFAALPKDLGSFLDAMNELVRRMTPLTQIAESAGGLFGLKIPGFPRAGGAPAPTPAPAAPRPAPTGRDLIDEVVAAKAAADPTVPAQKPAGKKVATKKATARKPAARKASTKKAAAKR